MVRAIRTITAGSADSFDADLQITFDKGVQSQYAMWFALLDWLKKAGRFEKVTQSSRINGKYMEFLTEMRRGGNAGARGENQDMPATDSAYYIPGRVDYMKGFQGRFDVTAAAMHWGKGNGVYADVFKQEMRNVQNVITSLGAQAFWGVGTGVLASLNGAIAGSTTAVVDSIEKYNLCVPGTRWLFEGQKLSQWEGGSSVLDDPVVLDASATNPNRVSSITSNTQFEFETSENAQDDDVLTNIDDVVANATAALPSYQGPEGVLAMIDGTLKPTYLNINSATAGNENWKGVEDHASGTLRPQTTKMLYDMYFKLGRKRGSVKLDGLRAWTNTDVYTDFAELLEPQVQFVARELDAGFQEMDLVVNSVRIPISLDYMAPSYWMFLNSKHIHFLDSRPLGTVPDKQGNIMVRAANRINWEIAFWWACNLYTKKRNEFAIIKDLDITINSL